jgi:hypothetical protein
MVKHIVLWKLKEPKAENAAKARAALETCRDVVPGMMRYEIGDDIGVDGAPWDLALYSEFVDREALHAYQVCAPHVVVKSVIGEIREARSCVDYETE